MSDSLRRTIQCGVCQATFTRHEHLVRHSRGHTTEKPFGCSYCGKSFSRSDALHRHIQSHTEKPVDSIGSSAQSLQSHVPRLKSVAHGEFPRNDVNSDSWNAFILYHESESTVLHCRRYVRLLVKRGMSTTCTTIPGPWPAKLFKRNGFNARRRLAPFTSAAHQYHCDFWEWYEHNVRGRSSALQLSTWKKIAMSGPPACCLWTGCIPRT